MRVDWVEPFSNHLQMKSCPGEVHRSSAQSSDRYLGCVVLGGNNRILLSFLTANQWPIFWKNARAETSEVVPKLKPRFACLQCSFFCVWVNCGSGENSTPPHAISCISLFLCFLSLSLSLPQNSIPHTDLLYTTTLYFLCVYGGVSLFFPCFSSPSQQDVSSGTQKSRSFGACLLLKHSCVTVSDTHTNSDVWRKVIALPGFISSVFLS